MMKKEWIYYLILSVVFLIAYVSTYDSKIAILGDNATYYMLGKGLSQFEGYINYASPSKAPHNHFPPGYPFFIAIIMFVTDNIQVIKAANGLLTFGTVLLTFSLVSRITGEKMLAAFIALVIAIHAGLLYYSSIMMSELIFTFTGILAIYLALKIPVGKHFYRDKYFYCVLLLIIYSFYTRAFGVALLGGVVVYFLYQKKWIHAVALFGGFVIGILPWQIRGYMMGGSNQFNVLFRKNYYRPEEGTISAADLWERAISNLERIISIELPNSILPVFSFTPETPGFTKWLTGLIILALIVYGVKKSGTFGIIGGAYFLFSLVILFIWPDYFSSERYLIPLLPIIAILFFNGLYQMIKLLLAKYLSIKKFHPAILGIFLFTYLPGLKVLSTNADRNYPIQWAEFFRLAEWAGKNTEEDAVICSRKPYLFYLFAHRLSVNYRYSEDPEYLLEGLNDHGVNYVVYDQLGFSTTPRCLGKAINQHQDKFKVIQYIGPENRRTYFFQYGQGN